MTFLATTLTACILVDDFSPEWQKGKAPDSCLSKIVAGMYYNEFRRDPEQKDMSKLSRVIALGNQHFLLMKKEEADKGGRLYRFHIIHGIFQRFRLDPVMKEPFKVKYPNAPVDLSHDTVRIDALGEKETALLSEIANQPDYWEIEEQTLYNPALNEECTLDDRDLKAMKADTDRKKPAKPKARK